MSTEISEHVIVYNDFVKEQLKKGDGNCGDSDNDRASIYAQIFFDLANVRHVGYRLCNRVVRVRQDINACNSTGGIVWESAYLLTDYLTRTCDSHTSNRSAQQLSVIDLGAGVGMLGLVLSQLGTFDVTVTEYDDDGTTSASNPEVSDCTPHSGVYALLESNIREFNSDESNGSSPLDKVRVRRLDWTKPLQDTLTSWQVPVDEDHKYDFVVGTDVIFTPTLVRPLLSVASALTRPDSGRCVFCMQIRCAESHELFLAAVSDYFNDITEVSEEVYRTEGCAWGRDMECLVFEMKHPISRVGADSMIGATSGGGGGDINTDRVAAGYDDNRNEDDVDVSDINTCAQSSVVTSKLRKRRALRDDAEDPTRDGWEKKADKRGRTET